VFSQDLKIADFWQRIDDQRKNALLQEPLKQIVKDLMKDFNDNHQPFANILESEGEDDCDDVQSCASCTKSDFETFEYEEAMQILKKPF